MMIIKRYLAQRIFSPVVGVFIFCVVVVAVFYLAQILAWAADDGWPLDVVFKMAALRLMLYFDVLIPVAVLIGIVVGVGRIQQAHELTALASAGVSRIQLFKLVTLPVGLVFILVCLFSIFLRPWGYTQFYEIEASLAERLDITRVEPGRFQVGDEQWLLYANRRDDGVLYDIFVHQKKPDGRGLLTADTLRQTVDEEGLITLEFAGHVSSYTLPGLGSIKGRHLVGQFDVLEVLVESKGNRGREKVRRALPITQLIGSERSIEIAEWQWRLVTPLSVLLLAWMAAFLASNQPRSLRSFSIVIALIAATLYFSLLGVLVNWVEEGQLGAFPGVFMAPLVLLAINIATSLFHRRRGLVH